MLLKRARDKHPSLLASETKTKGCMTLIPGWLYRYLSQWTRDGTGKKAIALYSLKDLGVCNIPISESVLCNRKELFLDTNGLPYKINLL